MAEARPRGWLLWVLLLQAAQAQPYTPIHQPGYCAFYDECGKNPELSGSLAGLADVSCLNNTRAPRLTGDHLALLQRICPRLYAGPDATFACCSRKQLLSLEKSLAITKALLTRCPACADNFVSLHCHNTCSPDQSAFINVTRVVVRGAGKPPAVVAYEAFYRRSFAERTYDSCSRVRIPAAATLAVGAMCGVYGSALCNAQRWLNYQGDTSNGLAPLDITFHLWEPDQAAGSPMQPLDAELTPCNQSQGGAAACSCQDCAASCPAIARPEALDATFRLGRLAADWPSSTSSPPLTFKDGTALALSCMADYGAPVFPFLAVGGYEGNDYSAAEALILTFSLNNYPPGDPRLAQARLWEGAFLEEVRAFQRQMAGTLQVTFMAERSLEDEISRTTAEDLPIFAISYLVIFLYISLALGSYTSWRRMPVDAKVTLGLGGVAVVLGAVMAAMGFFAYLSVPSSLVVLQVVPFLVLAVGADNIFIFVLEYQRLPRRPGERREAHIGRALGRVGPSMLLCSVSEAVCFFLGALTPMPAVRTFALTSGLALILDFLLQMSAFVALVSLDSRRQEGSRLDVCCCLRAQELPAPSSGGCEKGPRTPTGRGEQIIARQLEKKAKGPKLEKFIAGCESFSLTQKIQYATEFPEQSYLAIPASSWVDDFIDWLTPSSCCRLYSFGPNKDQFCPSTVNSLGCLKNCMSFTLGPVRPSVDQFHKYLPWFLSDPPNIKCPKGGLAAYSTSVKLDHDGQVLASRFMAYHKPLKNSQDYTEALRAARALAANITAGLRKVPGTDPAFEVFPYTITNVFYEQYLTVVPEGLFMLSLCLVPTFAVCCLLLGMDLRSGLINLFSIIMILVDTVGFMALWGISYNAVSLINLVTAVGISVEFVSHITRSFAVSTKPTRLERAKEATISMGSAVFAGVAMTNLPGILILGLAKAQLIQIFFFRLNLLITLLGLLHGLVFLPVILSYLGPDINMALVLEQRRAEEAAAARTASCKKHSIPVRWANGTYVNRGFQHPAESGDSFGDPPPQWLLPVKAAVCLQGCELPGTGLERWRGSTQPNLSLRGEAPAEDAPAQCRAREEEYVC
ncbi:LOW QUALITY PROTEIN: Niemann-Pick C1-like protein 1 [Myotis lucifugus]|uniref:LOW QUALITY PROTEIN: Niemann-Pick C1-like protein 1 n=1 Tax=Myotis lucifugus TaxID=59463 RepID=UPI000CCC0CFC|nr:LOW QUALITY PROTEIN: Niemann-Pick C1-like protein 1 [Myotis lucifugus]